MFVAAVNFGQFVDDAAVSADVFVLATDTVALAAVTVWNAVLADVGEWPVAAALAAAVLTSLACGAVTACFAVDPGYGML